MNPETRIQNECLLETGAHGGVMVWRQQSGVFKTMDGMRTVKVGQTGMADLGMIVAVTITPDMVGKVVGVAVQPEIKTRKGSQAEAQNDWQVAVKKAGGVYRLVRSPEQMRALITDVKTGVPWR